MSARPSNEWQRMVRVEARLVGRTTTTFWFAWSSGTDMDGWAYHGKRTSSTANLSFRETLSNPLGMLHVQIMPYFSKMVAVPSHQ